MKTTKHKKDKSKPQKTKTKKHKKGQRQTESMNGTGVIVYESSLIDEAVKESALAAKLEILRYAETFKSDNTKRPIKALADSVHDTILNAFRMEIEDAEPL